MKHVYIVEGNFCEDTWVEKVFGSLDKALTFLNKEHVREGRSENPYKEMWTNGLDWYGLNKKEVE